MTNYFVKNLSKLNNDIKESRAVRLAKQAEMAQDALLRKLKTTLLEKEGMLDDLEDLSPDTTVSLQVTRGDFNAVEWVNSVHNLKVDIANLTLEVEIAQTTYNKYFKESVDDQ